VQDGALLGDVDLLAGEHPIAKLLDPLLPCQREQEPQRLLRDACLE
jgi:hypothetical protein